MHTLDAVCVELGCGVPKLLPKVLQNLCTSQEGVHGKHHTRTGEPNRTCCCAHAAPQAAMARSCQEEHLGMYACHHSATH
jgi:hypothetical protein